MPEVFQTPEKVHITVGVLRIFSEEEEVCIMHVYIIIYSVHAMHNNYDVCLCIVIIM